LTARRILKLTNQGAAPDWGRSLKSTIDCLVEYETQLTESGVAPTKRHCGVRLCLSYSRAAAACGAFAAVCPAGRRYRSIAAHPAPQQPAGLQHCTQQQMPRLQLAYTMLNADLLNDHEVYDVARIVLNTQRLCPSQQLLQHLHWLPVYFHIK